MWHFDEMEIAGNLWMIEENSLLKDVKRMRNLNFGFIFIENKKNVATIAFCKNKINRKFS